MPCTAANGADVSGWTDRQSGPGAEAAKAQLLAGAAPRAAGLEPVPHLAERAAALLALAGAVLPPGLCNHLQREWPGWMAGHAAEPGEPLRGAPCCQLRGPHLLHLDL